MIAAFGVGVLSGLGLSLGMFKSGMLAERSGLAVLLGAIAFFYPVFAVQAQAGSLVIAVHVLVFAAFGGLALLGFSRGTAILAFGLIAHGFFDAATVFVPQPGPLWWPAYCGALDLTAGVVILILLNRKAVVS